MCYSRSCRLAYLHEGLEPKVVHRDVKSSNILLDRQWNPKVSDFGLAKLFCSEQTHVTTCVVGTFGCVRIPSLLLISRLSFHGFEHSDVKIADVINVCLSHSYVAPEYAYTGMLNEKSDLYSFGVLIMEVITGRIPVDYSRPKAEVSAFRIPPHIEVDGAFSSSFQWHPPGNNHSINAGKSGGMGKDDGWGSKGRGSSGPKAARYACFKST